MFSKEGPNLNKPEVTNNPNVTPKMYKLIKRNITHFKVTAPYLYF